MNRVQVTGDLDALDDFARELEERAEAAQLRGDPGGFLPRRMNADPVTGEKDLARIVLSLVDLIRRLMERQAARRVNAGTLSDDEVERLGETFLRLDRRMAEICRAFGLDPADLAINLGPIHDLLPEQRS
jgi:hypothetical protein